MADKDEEQRKEPQEPIVRDKRRIDPETGEPRAQGAGDEPAPAAADAEAGEPGEAGEELYVEDILNAADAETTDASSEHLADLKRVTAEYANYRRRTEANREVERERAIRDAVTVLLPVLDDLDRAQKHGDLDGDAPFATIAQKLRSAVEKLGLVPFGAAGETFDPAKHEAIFRQESAEATETTIVDVVEVGYTLGSTLVRPAKVVVQTPSA